MPYTLAMGIGWVLLALVLGGVIGFLLRSVTARRQVARARALGGGAELATLRARVAELEAARPSPAGDGHDRDPSPRPSPVASPGPSPEEAEVPPDEGRDRLAAVLGRAVEQDDLTVIEGIGPQVADLCHGIGIVTWADLAATEVSLLRTMLDDAGARSRALDPSTWPTQAALLAEGRYGEQATFVEQARGGGPAASEGPT